MTALKWAAIGVAAALSFAAPVLAQTAAPAGDTLTEAEIQSFRADVRADKRQVVAETLKLTDAEGAKFWPIYDKYTADLTRINDSRHAIIKEFADKFGSISDAQATDLTKRWLDADTRQAQLRSKYVPIVGKALPGVKTATFFQIDRRLSLLANLGLASQLPLVQSQTAK